MNPPEKEVVAAAATEDFRAIRLYLVDGTHYDYVFPDGLSFEQRRRHFLRAVRKFEFTPGSASAKRLDQETTQ